YPTTPTTPTPSPTSSTAPPTPGTAPTTSTSTPTPNPRTSSRSGETRVERPLRVTVPRRALGPSAGRRAEGRAHQRDSARGDSRHVRAASGRVQSRNAPGPALVQNRRVLRGVGPRLRRLQQRRLRRPARPDQQTRPPAMAGHRLPVAAADLPVTPARRRLRHLRIHPHPARIRRTGRLR